MVNTNVMTGIVKYYHNEKGWGFIIPTLPGAEVFFHFTGLNGVQTVSCGDSVSFEFAASNGKVKAINVTLIKR